MKNAGCLLLHTKQKICYKITEGRSLPGPAMLFYHIYSVELLCIGMLIVSLLLGVCAGYAYSLNSQRSEDDLEKKNYQLGAIIFTFLTWPFFLIAFISLFLIRALSYGFFLILFTIFLIIIPREASEPTWLEKTAASIGETLLEANTMLIKLFLRPWANEPT
jgi:ABC-type multidrug transport system permease subunit